MMTLESLYETLDQRRKLLGWSQADVGRRALGQSDGSVLQNIKRGSAPRLDNLLSVCEALGLDVHIGPRAVPAPLASLRIAEGEFVPIPERAATLAAGAGAVNDQDHVIGHLIFRKDWLSRHGIVAEKAALARVKGNSMAPCILDGDLVLIDTRETDIPVRELKRGKQSPIYAFHQDGDDRVKRIARPTADLAMILSDNPEYPPEAVTGTRLKAMNIIGRVRWWGHTVGD